MASVLLSSRSAVAAGIEPARDERLGVATELLARALRQHRAGPHDVDVVRDLERALDVLVDQEDRLALRGQAADQLVDERGHARLDTGGGLVDEEDDRIVHQAAGDLELALLAAAEGAGRLPAPLPQHRTARTRDSPAPRRARARRGSATRPASG